MSAGEVCVAVGFERVENVEPVLIGEGEVRHHHEAGEIACGIEPEIGAAEADPGLAAGAAAARDVGEIGERTEAPFLRRARQQMYIDAERRQHREHFGVAHITGPQTEQASVDRAEGIRQALEARGVSLIYATSYGEWTERWGRSACAMLLDQGKSVDAILCDSDQIARGALDALRERGISVPGDIAIMGFDNWDVIVDGTHRR